MSLFDRGLFFLLKTMERRNRDASLVGDHEFFDADRFPWMAAVAAWTPRIQAELAKVLQRREQLPNFQDISPDQRALTTDAGWKTFFFYGYGARCERNCQACPDTERALLAIPGMVSGYYSILAPGKRLPPHRGPYNGVLRYHLGLKIPVEDDRCAIRVGGETRSWHEGAGLVFDDTYEHAAWNLTSEWRVVLFVDFLRPLPAVQAVLNRLMIWIIRKTPFVAIAARNHKNWEKHFYDADPVTR